MSDDDKVKTLPVKFREREPDERTLLNPYDPPFHPNCSHQFVQYFVNEAEADVTCGKCGTRLNPMWVLGQLAREDRRYEANQKAAREMQNRLDERSRTKCQHCGKMTRISRR